MLPVDRVSIRRVAAAVTVGVIVFGTIVSSPALGVFSLSSDSDQLGDGTAAVETVSLQTDSIRITDGRFGTGVQYLRMPPASVQTSAIEGRSRLVYRVEVPQLDVVATATEPLSPGGGQTHSVVMDDVALQSIGGDARSFEGTVSVRVQSFEVDETVYENNVSIEVVR